MVIDTTPHPGLNIRMVLWPQSTNISVGPPDISMWCSGGLLEKLYPIKNSISTTFLMCTDTVYGQCHIFFNKIHAVQGLFKCFVQEQVNSVGCV